jgi:hypothetical protein
MGGSSRDSAVAEEPPTRRSAARTATRLQGAGKSPRQAVSAPACAAAFAAG